MAWWVSRSWPSWGETLPVLHGDERVVLSARPHAMMWPWVALIVLAGAASIGSRSGFLPELQDWWRPLVGAYVLGAAAFHASRVRSWTLTDRRLLDRSPFRTQDLPLERIARARLARGLLGRRLIVEDAAGRRLAVARGLVDPVALAEALATALREPKPVCPTAPD